MEYSAGLTIRTDSLKSEKLLLDIPPPNRLHLLALSPYRPVDEAVRMAGDKVWLDRSALQNAGENFRVDVEYEFEGPHALSGIVYSSSPMEVFHKGEDDEEERYWLHSGLKTTQFIRDLYRSVSVEETDVAVNVTLREDIKKALTEDLKFEIMMQANLSSHDRNVQARALAYRRVHPLPKFRGNLFQVSHDAEELFQPHKFKSFLRPEGEFKLNRCMKGPNLANLFLPMSVPDSMVVLMSTDLTLEEPARKGTLVYRKSAFAKRFRKIISG